MRVRSEHWQVILEFCEQNTELLSGKFNSSQGKAKANQLWLTLANRLNSLGFGEKSVESWRKALVDWKSKTKAKAASLKRAMEQTGGGPSVVPPLTDLETRLINLMGPTAISGDEGVPELGFVEVSNTTTRRETSVTPEIPTTSCDNSDHDYVLPAESKRTSQKRKVKRLRPVQRAGMTKELLELSKETVRLLGTMNENMTSISKSLKIIATAMQSSNSK